MLVIAIGFALVIVIVLFLVYFRFIGPIGPIGPILPILPILKALDSSNPKSFPPIPNGRLDLLECAGLCACLR